MSNRSLIELNHDYSGMIANHPEQFLELISEQLRSANNPEVAEAFRINFGVTVHGTLHHSDPWEDRIRKGWGE